MKLSLRIINHDDDHGDGNMSWELWGRGLRIDRVKTRYKWVKSAVRASRLVAKQLNVEIKSCEYFEMQTGYTQLLVLGRRIIERS